MCVFLLHVRNCVAAASVRFHLGFASQLNRYRALVEKYREAGAMHIKLHGWPPCNALVGAVAASAETEADHTDGSKQPTERVPDEMRGRYTQQEAAEVSRCCGLCQGRFGALWLHRGVCYACEMQLRETVRPCAIAVQTVELHCSSVKDLNSTMIIATLKKTRCRRGGVRLRHKGLRRAAVVSHTRFAVSTQH